MPVAHLIDVLELLAPAVELTIVAVLIAKKLWHRFPAFTAYAMLHVAKIPIEFFLRHHPGRSYYTTYFLFYWATEVLSAILTYAIIYDLYGQVFLRYEGLSRLGRQVLNWVAAILVLIGVGASAMTGGNDYTRFVSGIMAMQQVFDIVRLGLILFLFVFASFFRLRWSNYLFGIAVGLAFYGSCDLTAQALLLHYGSRAHSVSDILISSAYTCAVVIWLGYLLTRANMVDQSFELPANDLGAWNDALAGMLNGR
ncbi:MAG TPA: hypothetical protein VE998_09325 [Terriglobales bacterium]|nr:hypothetical protein [Terriglobales bacterium]